MQIAKALAGPDEMMLNPKESEIAVFQSDKVFIRQLQVSKTVHFGMLDSFHLINYEGAVTEVEATVSKIKQVNVRFTPSEEFKEALLKANFKELSSL